MPEYDGASRCRHVFLSLFEFRRAAKASSYISNACYCYNAAGRSFVIDELAAIDSADGAAGQVGGVDGAIAWQGTGPGRGWIGLREHDQESVGRSHDRLVADELERDCGRVL